MHRLAGNRNTLRHVHVSAANLECRFRKGSLWESGRQVFCRLGLMILLGTLRAPGQSEPAPINRTTGFVYGDIYLKHDTGVGHPERAERLTAIVSRLEEMELLPKLVAIEPEPAAPEWITTIHTPE